MGTDTTTFDTTGRPPFLAISLLSAAAIAYEVLLVRLLAIVQWHHFAHMVISLALLGYGASGTFLTLLRPRLAGRWSAAFIANAMLFGVAAVVCFKLAQRVPFNAEEVLWDVRQPLRMAFNYLILALPFFFAANAVGIALQWFGGRIGRVYAADLAGAAIGSAAAVAALFVLFPVAALVVAGIVGIAAGAVAAWELGLARRWPVTLAAVAAGAFAAAAGVGERPALSPYKSLSQTLRIGGTEVVAERASPLGWLAVVESDAVPLRHVPGLSLTARAEPPAQVGVFTDGDGMTAITRWTGDVSELVYLEAVTAALPYRVRPIERVLVLGAGGGAEVLQALHFGATAVDAVELNRQIVELVRGRYREFSGRLYDRAAVRVAVADARGFVAAAGEHYDLVQLALVDSFAASAAGLQSLSESYLYTVEALQSYLAHLRPDGVLAITRWIAVPPRDMLKLVAAAVDALRASGVADPGRRLALIRGWQTGTLLVKNGEFTASEIDRLLAFCAEHLFDAAYFDGMPAALANRFNRLPRPYFFEGTRAIIGPGRDAYLARYKFGLTPATDDRPFHAHFFKWRTLPEILALRDSGGMPLVEWGYLVLIATLVKALLASAVLILLPLWWFRRRNGPTPSPVGRRRTLVYFTAIGLAFLFIEIAFIQKFILVFHHPVYAVAAGLTAFLLFAGLGSAWSRRYDDAFRRRRGVALAIGGIVTVGLLHVFVLAPLASMLAQAGPVTKVAAAIGAVAPLAFCMGLPFPLAMSTLSESAPRLVPWAWGVNGCASVVSAVLATVVAVHLGFQAVILMGLGLYVVALLAQPTGQRVGASGG